MQASGPTPKFKPVDTHQSFPALEEQVLERWRQRRVFERSMQAREGAPVWSFYEGPPTANGRPGSHHVLSRVFKDIFPRYKAMRGYRVPRKAGWDCHGLPVELEVEKELGISSKQEIEEYGIAEFNRKCRESVFTYVEEWNRLTERIGFWLDLDDAYFTLHDSYIESVWWSLRRLWDEGLLYEGHRVSPYCPRCGTALSSHEVALGYKEVEDPSAYVRLTVTEAPAADTVEAGDRLLIWTTTPWTLPGNYAVAVAPGVDYVRVRHGDEVLVMAEALVEKVLGEEAGAAVLGRLKGGDLVGARYAAPIFKLADREPGTNPVIAGDFVTTEDGTGLVHLAPAYGDDDYNAIREAGLYDPADPEQTLYNPVDLDGNFTSQVTGFEGRFVKDPEVTESLLADLERRGLLFKAESYTHSYPHCWRCGTPLLYYAKASWYIRTSAARDALLRNNSEINWQPPHIKEGRFGRWLENNVDWALSRDRYWGTPLPIWECESADCDERCCIGSVEELRERALGEVPDDLHRPYIDEVEFECGSCGGRMRRVPSVIDTWYDSGAMPFAQHHYPFENKEIFEERFPADFICEAIDQTRGWFYTLLAESTLLFDQTSYRNCVCLGLLLDGEGQKMSKSRGNVVAPWDVIDAHGADAFRWYLFTAQQPWSGYRFSIDGVGESLRQFMLTLWNTYSFWVLYANAEGVGPADFGPGAPASEDPLDRWVLSRLQSTTAIVIEQLDAFDVTAAGREIAAFVEELSNWYVRLSRRRFWDGDRAAFATLRHCLLEVAALLAPFTPFLADEIHLNLAHGAAGFEGAGEDGSGEPGSGEALPDSVHLRSFPEPAESLIDEDLEAAMTAVRRTVELGRAARAQAKAKVRQPLRRAVIVANEAEREAINAHAELVRSELNVKELEFVSEEGELVRYSVKPNFRSLGPRFGSQMPQVAAAVQALDASHVARALEAGETVGINIAGQEHELGSDDLSLVLEPLEGYQVEAESGHAVALALELDEELIAEGRAREIVHAVQNARKQAGLDITDRISLVVAGAPELVAAAEAHRDYIAAETLATSFTAGNGIADGAHTSEAKIDKLPLTITLSRA